MSNRSQSSQPQSPLSRVQAQAKREMAHQTGIKSQQVHLPGPTYDASIYRSAQTRQVMPQDEYAVSPSVKPPVRRKGQPAKKGKLVKKVRSQGRPKAWLAGGSMAFLAALAFVPGHLKPNTKDALHTTHHPVCQVVVKSGAQLSRDQLSRLLSVPERSSKEAIQRIATQPYCTLPTLEARSGVKAEREAYPLAFDPDTWLVLLYENGEYAGYDFAFR
jgi:hypothetical protein